MKRMIDAALECAKRGSGRRRGEEEEGGAQKTGT